MDQPRTHNGRYTFKRPVLAVGAAMVVAVAAASGVGTSGAGAGAGGAATPTAGSPTVSVEARIARGQQRAGRAQRGLAVRLRVQARVEADSASCSGGARGQVRDFLARHSCESVYRSSYAASERGVGAVVAVAWIDMVDERDAAELKALVDRPGTGNVDALPPPRGTAVVDLAEPAYASRQRGRTVVTVEVEPAAMGVSRLLLERLAEEAAEEATPD